MLKCRSYFKVLLNLHFIVGIISILNLQNSQDGKHLLFEPLCVLKKLYEKRRMNFIRLLVAVFGKFFLYFYESK